MPQPLHRHSTPIPLSPHPEGSDPRKRRASKACSSCRSRKIRCDVLQAGIPCSKCRIDQFKCNVEDRKKRRKKLEVTASGDGTANAIPQRRAMPEHVMLHQVPHYPFFRNFNPRGEPWLHAQDGGQGVLLPVSARDQSASFHGAASTGPSDDLRFLKVKGALDLPPKEIVDQCVSHYFQIFHPFFPIIDKPSFLKSYSGYDGDINLQNCGISLLLLQAIIFTATAIVPHQTISEMGFSSRREARSCFHTRAKFLHNFEYESDDIVTIQALLLMSHYYPSMVEQRHTWFWVHQAIGLAQGAGLHRDADEAPQRSLWARIWWACLVRDRLIALGTGRPMHINSLDCNVPLLNTADLEEEGDCAEDFAVKAIFIEFLKLCQYMEGILSLPLATSGSLQQQISLCESTLQSWLSNLNPAARLRESPTVDVREGGISTLYRTLLHLIYNVVLMSLRQPIKAFDSKGDRPRLPSPEVQSIAEKSIKLMGDLMGLDLARFCPTQTVTTVLPPLIVQLLLMRYTENNFENELVAARFQTSMRFLKELGQIYWHAGFYHEILELAAPGSQSSAAVNRRLRKPTDARRAGKRPNKTLEVRWRTMTSDDTRLGPEIPQQSQLLEAPTASHSNPSRDLSPVVTMASTAPETTYQTFPDILTATGADGLGDEMFFNTDNYLFEEWLDDPGLFSSMFPSA